MPIRVLKKDKREIGRRGRDPYAVQPRKPSPQPSDKLKPGIGSLQKADIEKNNKIKEVKAKYASLKETARDELTPMKSDRVFSKFRRPDSAKEFYADKPGSKYEGMAKEAMQNRINYYKNMKRGGLSGGRKKLDKNKDGKITGEDFKMMRKGYGAARTSGMGLQDESIKPGKVMKAGIGAMMLAKKMKDEDKKMPIAGMAAKIKSDAMEKILGRSKGGGADTGRLGDLKSKVYKYSKNLKKKPGLSPEDKQRIIDLMKSREPKQMQPLAKKMGGGMMQKYQTGGSVMARGCKLGRKKATKLY